jgi:uncharacterized protein YycO
MKAAKIIFAVITLGLSFYFALKISNAVFHKSKISENKVQESGLNSTLDGDMIFQTSQSSQCEAVRIATNSKFSHCGIIYIQNGQHYVYEAVQPVKMTKLDDWITHGENKSYVVKRLKNSKSILTKSVIEKMKNYGSTLMNKNYDLYFGWSDDKIYCSELVWKIYKNGANIELCSLEKLKNFNLKNPKVQTIMNERYGKNVPLEEDVVAPSQLVDSKILETILDTY